MIGGVGSVIVFLPQILILFFFIAVLEDCGYMARAAYLMDRLMVRVGLSGKSFIPLLSSFACAIPGVMATRVIENRRDRLTTILVAPLMSCSARLPVYTLLIGAFIPSRTFLGGWLGLQGLTLFAMYLVGIVTAVFVALVLKKTLLRGANAAVCDGVAAVQDSVAFDRAPPDVRARLVVYSAGRNADRGGGGDRLGVALLSAQRGDRGRRIAAARKVRFEQQIAALPPGGTSAERRKALERELARFHYPEERKKLEAGAYQRQSCAGANGAVDRAGRSAARLGLADRLRGDRFVSCPRSRARHAGRDL